MLRHTVDAGRRGVVTVAFTERSDGDYAVGSTRPPAGPAPHTWLRQVHGGRVVRVAEPGDGCGEPADAACTCALDAALTIRTADCVPIALVGSAGGIAAVHAGWRGLLAGVVDAAVTELRGMGEREIDAIVGPAIHAECYEFGEADLQRMVARFGGAVAAITSKGRPALDLPATVAAALRTSGVRTIATVDRCTACEPGEFFSHRARGETQRHVMVMWRSGGER